jgi:hypothetical protein
VPQELHADLAEKSPDDHIQFVKDGFFFSACKKSLDDQEDQKDIEKQKSEIPDHVEENMMGIMENEIVDGVGQHRSQDQKKGDPEGPAFYYFFHVFFLELQYYYFTPLLLYAKNYLQASLVFSKLFLKSSRI